MRVARLDPKFSARIVARQALRYHEGADAAEDRPSHVRSASGAAWLGDRLALVQDDALFLALVEPESGVSESVALPAGPGGKRLFDDTRGTKHLKLDLEACFTVRGAETTDLYAFGSGSAAPRERVVVMRYDHATRQVTSQRVVDASSLYAGLRAEPSFSGSELNLEGALLREDTLLLFQRGNGAPRAGLGPVNAIGSLPWTGFVRYLDRSEAAPSLSQISQYDLGSVAGVPYTFTDAALAPRGGLVFLASAEDSSSALTDGAVYGTCVGEIAADGSARIAPLLDEQGAPSRDKAEGIALDPADPARAWAVVDRDDPESPSELLEVRLTEMR
jgi:hypothetical protein